jgi:hypothetical protein
MLPSRFAPRGKALKNAKVGPSKNGQKSTKKGNAENERKEWDRCCSRESCQKGVLDESPWEGRLCGIWHCQFLKNFDF